jgi:hypothetical protein
MRLNEELIESHTIYRGRVVTLRIDTVRLPNGNTARREIVEHRGAVAIVPLLDHETVLLIRQYRQAVGETLLEIPAGTLEPDEPPDACARRELQEETGYTARQLRPPVQSVPCAWLLAGGAACLPRGGFGSRRARAGRRRTGGTCAHAPARGGAHDFGRRNQGLQDHRGAVDDPAACWSARVLYSHVHRHRGSDRHSGGDYASP